MNNNRIWAVVALIVIACFATMVFTDLAHAQQGAKDTKSAKGSDKKVATRTGVSGALADGDGKDLEGPTKTQMAIGFGSIVVMIAVMKWL